ncbi:hypothetical protein LMH87_010303 [Akanthomyces muscarius]|uniref:Uncharacterized protein n=1 Tax=Akanthomyces muscarius TaxID=2231603 RepID=A0A9W8QEP1_AKAMU|nr:hypothetical protein LMH87_010303 [Akanthomyces muscarius]KAJ4153832.1 hypothetical protein LMH87_010303 [Akanthomyces muscarius]
MRPAQPCWKLKRAVDAINKHAADTLPPHDGVQERAAATPTDLDLFAASAYDHLVHLAANASPDPDAFYEQHRLHSARRDDNQLRCAGDGAACWARGAEQSGEVEKRWCMRPAQPCWKTRRAAESILNAGQEDDDGASEECGADDGENFETLNNDKLALSTEFPLYKNLAAFGLWPRMVAFFFNVFLNTFCLYIFAYDGGTWVTATCPFFLSL